MHVAVECLQRTIAFRELKTYHVDLSKTIIV